MSEKSESAGSNNRWWESYLVRYFLGFIVGTICIAVIAQFAGVIPGSVTLMQAIGSESKSGVTSTVIAVALLGMAYCYIASTPITVLHAGRFSRGAVDRLSRFFWLGWVCALAFLMVSPLATALRFDNSGYVYWTVFGISVVIIIGWALTRFHVKNGDNNGTGHNVPNAYKKRDYLLVVAFSFAVWSFSQGIPLFFGVHAQTADARLLALGTPVIWIGIVQYFVLFKIHWNETANYYFYKKLFAARQLTGAKDVRDTYSHLREHSNAIFIVAVEISMLALVIGSIRVQRSAHDVSASSMDSVTFWLCALCIWIVPTVFMWSRANGMERYFCDHPEEFIPKKSRKPLPGRPDPQNGASAGMAAGTITAQPVPSTVAGGQSSA